MRFDFVTLLVAREGPRSRPRPRVAVLEGIERANIGCFVGSETRCCGYWQNGCFCVVGAREQKAGGSIKPVRWKMRSAICQRKERENTLPERGSTPSISGHVWLPNLEASPHSVHLNDRRAKVRTSFLSRCGQGENRFLISCLRPPSHRSCGVRLEG
jgi:hypothetical protein